MGAVTSMFWRDKVQEQTITPNSMSPIPKHKFLNFARTIAENIDDIPSIQKYGKSKKQKKALESYYDYYNY
tara:strand:- start:1665 stop:1877 length:213 start_codon:yes stop_codon:yes gene_type:complete